MSKFFRSTRQRTGELLPFFRMFTGLDCVGRSCLHPQPRETSNVNFRDTGGNVLRTPSIRNVRSMNQRFKGSLFLVRSSLGKTGPYFKLELYSLRIRTRRTDQKKTSDRSEAGSKFLAGK